MPRPTKNISNTVTKQVLYERNFTMKKIISVILAVLCLAAALCSCGNKPAENATTTSPAASDGQKDTAVYTCDDFNYVKLDDGTAKIISYNKAEAPSELVIPHLVDGIKVTVLGENTFTEKQQVSTVRLSQFITKIEPKAFNKSSVKGIQFWTSQVETVESYTFNECANLKQIVFNDSVKHVKDSAFYLCSVPRVIHFTVDPVELSAMAFDSGRGYDGLEIKHYGDISNFKNVAEFAALYNISLVLVEATNK